MANDGKLVFGIQRSKSQRDSAREYVILACNNHEELVSACKRALPWIGKMIADKAHLNSVLPNDCIGAMEQLEVALTKVGK